MTYYKQLCAELIDALDSGIPAGRIRISLLADRARAALAEPEQEGPTVMEIIELADQIEEFGLGQVDLVRAALVRWGNNNTSRSNFDG